MWNKIKNAWKSKTVLFGLLLQLPVLLLQLAPVMQTYFADIGDPRGYMIIGVIVILLRAVTTKPLDAK